MSAFEAATISWSERGNRGRAGVAIDDAPSDLGELADYFGSLSPAGLAGCWVAAIVDVCVGTELSPGDMSRALVIVAERLHGVKFDIAGVPPVTEIKPLTGPTPAPPVHQIKATAPPKQVGRYTVNAGSPPEPAGRKSRRSEAIAAALCLDREGAWFEWTDGPKVFSSPAMSKKFTEACRFQVIVYRSTAGKVIVKRCA